MTTTFFFFFFFPWLIILNKGLAKRNILKNSDWLPNQNQNLSKRDLKNYLHKGSMWRMQKKHKDPEMQMIFKPTELAGLSWYKHSRWNKYIYKIKRMKLSKYSKQVSNMIITKRSHSINKNWKKWVRDGNGKSKWQLKWFKTILAIQLAIQK